ncbi:hypothetical protein COCON_G00090270 [Conger conger]|uniref:E3 ubiquitin-protein ligase MSL2 n=1 Tax=Conger conger TaxID=82655 RepID=A0A9Q1I0L7_CONCO|nr:hypothetical protein COCON_G00090270 [Conger conger]
MNPVDATALYVSACRSVLQCDPQDPQSLAELFKLLPFFKLSLSCLVCGNLLNDPMAPTNSSCQHYVCKACNGKKMNMKQSCSWCKDEQFEESKQLSILVECYKKLFEYIAESSLAHYITSSAEDYPEVLELLEEGLSWTEKGLDEPSISVSLSSSRSPTPSASETDCGAQPEASTDLREPLPDTTVFTTSGDRLEDFIALGEDELAASSVPSPEAVSAPVAMHCGESPKPQSFPDSLVVDSELVDVCGLDEDVDHGDGPLLLSVEEVLRRLDPSPEEEGDPETFPGASDTPNDLSLHPSVQDPEVLAPCHPQPPSSGISCLAATPKTVRLNRKRSWSEGDSEKIQPLPISNIIHGPPAAAVVVPVIVKQEADDPALPTATVTNGSMAKVSKLLLVPSKGFRKNPDHGAKKLYAKSRPTIPKKDKSKDRLPGHSLESGSVNKAVYKKTQEKKGCKCGRATQNPSVLTCRGQRCPCYSNRKACLDCICRGCQNSYMANGEKKLEAFAVPEKALEQTRLTLGINLATIAVRNAGANGGVLNMSACSPVTAFFAASSHEGDIFDENLDMRF